jgi:hypothetical protein
MYARTGAPNILTQNENQENNGSSTRLPNRGADFKLSTPHQTRTAQRHLTNDLKSTSENIPSRNRSPSRTRTQTLILAMTKPPRQPLIGRWITSIANAFSLDPDDVLMMLIVVAAAIIGVAAVTYPIIANVMHDVPAQAWR